MPRDPVCGMQVEESTGYRVEKDGETTYFCSASCKRKFLEAREGGSPADPVADAAGGQRGSRG